MSDRSDFPDEDFDTEPAPGEGRIDAVGLLAVAGVLAAIGLMTYLFTAAMAGA